MHPLRSFIFFPFPFWIKNNVILPYLTIGEDIDYSWTLVPKVFSGRKEFKDSIVAFQDNNFYSRSVCLDDQLLAKAA